MKPKRKPDPLQTPGQFFLFVRRPDWPAGFELRTEPRPGETDAQAAQRAQTAFAIARSLFGVQPSANGVYCV